MKKSILLSISCALAASFAGATFVACGGDDTAASVGDGGQDATPDSTMPVDSGSHPDVAIDTSTPDVGTDAGTPDVGADSKADTGSDSGDAGDGGTSSEAGDADAGNPPPPTLGVQIDRIGRPGVNTALNHTFDPDASAAGAAKDKYNADNTPTGWVAAYSGEIQKNLAILDSLDAPGDGGPGSGCGNQPFANVDAGAARYATLGGVLADDRLWVNTAATACLQYLGVELIATGVLPADGGVEGGPTNECGGRKLNYDVIQTTYSITSGVGLSGFGSGVSAVPTKVNGTTFPYLAPPQ